MQGTRAGADAAGSIAITDREEPDCEEPHDEHVSRTIRRLSDHFGRHVTRDVIEARVRALYSSFATATVHDFVPILVERQLRREFRRGPGTT